MEVRKTFLNFSDLANNSQNIRIYDGDVINIKKLDPKFADLKNVYKSGLIARYLNVTIAGRVRNPE